MNHKPKGTTDAPLSAFDLALGQVVLLPSPAGKRIRCEVEWLMDEGVMLRRLDTGEAFYRSHMTLAAQGVKPEEAP